eukprot:symbB.v1.2.010398.t1/scaffold681.1/size173109/6
MTAYVVAVVCVAGAFLASYSKDTMSRQLFLVFALVTTASFGLGGVSQMQLAKMERENVTCGSSWQEENHGWMYSWLFAVTFSPFSPATLAALAISTTEISGRVLGIMAVFALALAVATFQIYEFATSGFITAVYPRSVMFVNLLVAIIAPGMEARLRRSSLAVMTSAALYLIGGGFQASVVLENSAFTENAMCHVMVAISAALAWFASQAKAVESNMVEEGRLQPYREIREGKVEESMEVDEFHEPCCFCFKRRRSQEKEWTYFRP